MTTAYAGWASCAISARHIGSFLRCCAHASAWSVRWGNDVRKRPRDEFGTVGRIKMKPAGICRGQLHDSEQVAAAFGRRRGIDDDAASLIAKSRAENARPRGSGGGIRVKCEQPFLLPAEVLHTRDDFLPGVAALAKADAAQSIPVLRLVNELVLHRGRHDGDARADRQPLPDGEGGRCRVDSKSRARPA